MCGTCRRAGRGSGATSLFPNPGIHDRYSGVVVHINRHGRGRQGDKLPQFFWIGLNGVKVVFRVVSLYVLVERQSWNEIGQVLMTGERPRKPTDAIRGAFS